MEIFSVESGTQLTMIKEDIGEIRQLFLSEQSFILKLKIHCLRTFGTCVCVCVWGLKWQCFLDFSH